MAEGKEAGDERVEDGALEDEGEEVDCEVGAPWFLNRRWHRRCCDAYVVKGGDTEEGARSCSLLDRFDPAQSFRVPRRVSMRGRGTAVSLQFKPVNHSSTVQ